MTFTPAVTPPPPNGRPAYWFIFQDYHLLVGNADGQTRVPLSPNTADLGLALLRSQFLGYLDVDGVRVQCYSGELEEQTEAPLGMSFQGLRSLFGQLDENMLALAGRAVQIVSWDRTHQFCGQCGSKMASLDSERAKKCSNCGHTNYPRLAPAIIVSVERQARNETELLLARNQRNPRGFFSVLAGFVEPGESLEECVRREVREEVGLEIENIRYFGSQPWPFPNSLMIAFTADYAGGELRLEEEEIAEAGWFSAANLPAVPPSISISRRLIDAFVEKNTRGTAEARP